MRICMKNQRGHTALCHFFDNRRSYSANLFSRGRRVLGERFSKSCASLWLSNPAAAARREMHHPRGRARGRYWVSGMSAPGNLKLDHVERSGAAGIGAIRAEEKACCCEAPCAIVVLKLTPELCEGAGGQAREGAEAGEAKVGDRSSVERPAEGVLEDGVKEKVFHAEANRDGATVLEEHAEIEREMRGVGLDQRRGPGLRN